MTKVSTELNMETQGTEITFQRVAPRCHEIQEYGSSTVFSFLSRVLLSHCSKSSLKLNCCKDLVQCMFIKLQLFYKHWPPMNVITRRNKFQILIMLACVQTSSLCPFRFTFYLPPFCCLPWVIDLNGLLQQAPPFWVTLGLTNRGIQQGSRSTG